MKFDMTEPCNDCPFLIARKFPLGKARKREIAMSLLHDATFPCHKTTKFNEDDEHTPHKNEQHCAGAMIALEKIDRPNQLMRIAECFGGYDRTKLNMNAKVHSIESWARR